MTCVIPGVPPRMRAAGSGAIIAMSSQGGRMSSPAVGSYSAAKFALEGWSETLAGEVAPFGIRVLIVEPSRFRTEFNSRGVLRPDAPLRLPLGAEAVRNFTASYQRSLDDVRRWAQVSEAADFPGLPPAVRGFQRAAR